MVAATATKPATAKQIALIEKLMAEKSHKWVGQEATVFTAIQGNRQWASYAITTLLAAPKKTVAEAAILSDETTVDDEDSWGLCGCC